MKLAKDTFSQCFHEDIGRKDYYPLLEGHKLRKGILSVLLKFKIMKTFKIGRPSTYSFIGWNADIMIL